MRNTLRRLYDSFARQGPERQVLVDIVREQDERERNRIVHFLMNANGTTLGHAQILIAKDESESLHIETQWGTKLPGTKRGELGRLFFYRPNEIRLRDYYAPNRWDPDATAPWKTHQMSKFLLFQKLMSYASHDAGLDSLSLQINHGVFTLLKRMDVPLHLATDKIVFSEHEGEKIQEHLLVFDREAMRSAERVLLQKLISLHLENFVSHDPMRSETIALRFSRNEFRALFESGLFKTQQPALLAALANAKPRVDGKQRLIRTMTVDTPSQELDENGGFRYHIAVPSQSDYGTERFPRLSRYENGLPINPHRYDFETGIFQFPDVSQVADADFIELHFSRESVGYALVEFASTPEERARIQQNYAIGPYEYRRYSED